MFKYYLRKHTGANVLQMYELVNCHISECYFHSFDLMSDHMITSLPADVQESPRVGNRWSAVSLNGISYSDAGEYWLQSTKHGGDIRGHCQSECGRGNG